MLAAVITNALLLAEHSWAEESRID